MSRKKKRKKRIVISMYKKVVGSWALAILSGALFLLFFETAIYFKKTQIKSLIDKEATEFSGTIISKFNNELNKLIYLNSGIEAYIKTNYQSINSNELNEILKRIVEKDAFLIRNIGIAEKYTIKYVEPLEGNEKALGVDYRKIPQQFTSVQRAIENRTGTMDGPLNLVQGGKGLIYRSPIFVENEYWGLLSTVINFDNLCAITFDNLTNADFKFAISFEKQNYKVNTFYGDYTLFEQNQCLIVTSAVPNGHWYYAVVPSDLNNFYKNINLIEWIGRLFSIVLVYLILTMYRLRQRSLEQHEKYKLLSEHSSDVIGVFNIKNKRFTYLSPSILKFSGYTPEEGMQLHFRRFIHRDSVPSMLKTINSNFKKFLVTNDSEKHFLIQFKYIKKNGNVSWAEFSAHFQYNLNKELELIGITHNINHIKTIENQLRTSKRFYKIAHEIADMGHWEYDITSRNLQWSDELYKILGTERASTKASIDNYFEFIHPDDYKQVLQKYYYAFEHFEKYEIQYRLKLKDGKIKHINDKCRVEKDKDGKPVIAIAIIQDITSKVEKEKTIKQLSQAVEQSPVSIVITNKEANIIYANEFTSKVTGYDNSELLGKNPKILNSGLTPKEDIKNLWTTLASGNTWHGIFTNRKKNGDIYSESAIISPLKTLNDEIYAYLAVKEDITEKLKAEQEIAASEKRWKMAFESANDGVWDWNIQTNKLLLSDRWHKTLGYKNNEIASMQTIWEEVIHPSEYVQARNAIKEHINGKTEFYSDIHRMRCKDGSYKWFQDRGKVITFTEDGKPERMIGAHFDITTRMKLQQELQKLINDKDQFMSILAHDLRSPFNGLLGFMSIIIEDLEDYKIEELRNMLLVVNDTAVNIYNLLEDILTWSKSQSGSLVYEPNLLNIYETFEDVYELLNPSAVKKLITLEVISPKNLQIMADQNMMRTIIRNLISNAIKFTRPSGKIILSAELETNHLLIQVKDNGIGMNNITMSKLWNKSTPYTTKGTENEAGTGLGLLLCKEMVELHGGKIWVESELGNGTSFCFTIPLSEKKGTE